MDEQKATNSRNKCILIGVYILETVNWRCWTPEIQAENVWNPYIWRPTRYCHTTWKWISSEEYINVESSLNKKHSAIAYHFSRWNVAAGVCTIAWIPTGENIVDAMTKIRAKAVQYYLFGNCTYWWNGFTEVKTIFTWRGQSICSTIEIIDTYSGSNWNILNIAIWGDRTNQVTNVIRMSDARKEYAMHQLHKNDAGVKGYW